MNAARKGLATQGVFSDRGAPGADVWDRSWTLTRRAEAALMVRGLCTTRRLRSNFLKSRRSSPWGAASWPAAGAEDTDALAVHDRLRHLEVGHLLSALLRRRPN